MKTIKITITAYGCVGDGYSGKETKQEKILDKDTEEDQLTEIDLKEILETLIVSVREIKALYPDEQTDVIYHHDSRLACIKFEIILEDHNKILRSFDEQSLFIEAAIHQSLSQLLLDYCRVTDNGEEGTRIWISHEYDEGPPAGTHAILALVDQDKKWIPHYIEFLRTNDLDHEVEQLWDIKKIIKKYDWCEETIRLAIARNISCCGQGGRQQFNDLLNDGLKDYLKKEKHKKYFIDSIIKEFQEWDAVEFRLKDGSKKYYIEYIISYVKHFSPILTEDEINKIEILLLDRWDVFQEN